MEEVEHLKDTNATAPDGTLSTWKSVYNGTGGDASLYKVGGEVTTSNSTEHTLSIFAKVPSTNTYITGVRIRTFNNNHSATFNLLTGTIVGGVRAEQQLGAWKHILMVGINVLLYIWN